MVGEDRNSLRADRNRAFGERLTAARKAVTKASGKPRYKRGKDFIDALAKRLPAAKLRAYYSHEAGDRVPRDDSTITAYAELLGVSVQWLMTGTEDKVNAASLKADRRPVNQTTETLNINRSKMPPVRYIPILAASDIRNMINGIGSLPSMTADILPLPPQVAAGAKAYAYTIPQHDQSMVGDAGLSFPPGTILTVDPGRDILPGDFVLAWPSSMPAPVMRRFQSSWGLIGEAPPRYPFKLRALNPVVEPLVVESEDDSLILGRIVAYSHVL